VNKNLKEKFLFTAKGFCMGTADVIPGVSGGTMAFILGIYERLINAIKSFDLQWLRGIARFDFKIILGRPDFSFIIPLVTGIILALMFFTRVVPLPVLIQTHPEPVYALFFGLITGSIFILFTHFDRLVNGDYFYTLAGVAVGLVVFNLVPVNTPETGWFVFISGALAICAMVLPGISGSFILLILKKYDYVFNAIGHFDFSVLVPFGLGVITGLALFVRFLSWVLTNFYRATIMVINGLLIASLWVIWPFQVRTYEVIRGKKYLIGSIPSFPHALTADVVLALVLVLAGIAVVIIINNMAKKVS
jgi:putative membrane protein